MKYVFAYGSLMDPKDFSRSEPVHVYVGPAVLPGYRLAFSRYSLFRKGGVADIIPSSKNYVEGVVYAVKDFKRLDAREGAPFVYRRIPARVFIRDHQEWVMAYTYTVVHKSPIEFAPSPEYAGIIWRGAQVLSPEYRRFLKKKLFQRKGIRFLWKRDRSLGKPI